MIATTLSWLQYQNKAKEEQGPLAGDVVVVCPCPHIKAFQRRRGVVSRGVDIYPARELIDDIPEPGRPKPIFTIPNCLEADMPFVVD
jgi:hypothetical protein